MGNMLKTTQNSAMMTKIDKEREFWVLIRRALMMVVKAIEQFKLGEGDNQN